MAIVSNLHKPRSRRLNEHELTRSGFTCALSQPGVTVCSRVLWEDDRLGRISEVVEVQTQQARLQVEIPAGRTASGLVTWKPLNQVPGANTAAVHALLMILKEIAGDHYARTAGLRAVEPFEVDETVRYGGVV